MIKRLNFVSRPMMLKHRLMLVKAEGCEKSSSCAKLGLIPICTPEIERALGSGTGTGKSTRHTFPTTRLHPNWSDFDLLFARKRHQ